MLIFLRLSAVFILVLSVFILPWWMVVILGIAATFFFSGFYEIVGIGFMIDVFYGVPRVLWHGFNWWYTLGAIVLVLAVLWLKPRMYRDSVWFKKF